MHSKDRDIWVASLKLLFTQGAKRIKEGLGIIAPLSCTTVEKGVGGLWKKNEPLSPPPQWVWWLQRPLVRFWGQVCPWGGATASVPLLRRPDKPGQSSRLSCLASHMSASISLSLAVFLPYMNAACWRFFQLPAYCNWFPSSSTGAALPKVMVDILMNKPNGYFLHFYLPWPL